MPKWPSTLLSVCPSNTAVAGCQGQDELLLYPLDIRPHPRYVYASNLVSSTRGDLGAAQNRLDHTQIGRAHV